MKEIWIKKTIYRRYLIEEDDMMSVESILEQQPERAEELINDIFDVNNEIEYDEEKIILPIDYTIGDA